MTDIDRLTQRVDQLEGVVRALYPLVKQLRAEVSALNAQRGIGDQTPETDRALEAHPAPGAQAAEPEALPSRPVEVQRVQIGSNAGPSRGAGGTSTPVAPRPQPRSPRQASLATGDVSLEAAVGRYGALALATVSILLGIGAFVQWAVARGLLGPEVRVVLGLVAAAAVATLGLRLRAHGSRRFGHTLLALALAIVHVDGWGAGPTLHLVAAPVALSVVAVASAALAWLALVDGEPTIFTVGVGGALLAPFVTSTGEPHVVALLTFGYVVIATAVWAVRDRGWSFPVALLAAGSVLYTATSAEMPAPDWTSVQAFLPSAFAVACAATALFVLPPQHRSTLAQGALIALWEALARLTAHGSLPTAIVAGAAIGTIMSYATLPQLGDAPLRTLLGGCLLPLALLGNAVWVVPSQPVPRALVVAAWAAAASIAATYYDRLSSAGPPRDSAAAAGRSLATVMAGLEAGAAIVIALGERHAVLAIVGLSVYATALAAISVEQNWRSALVPVFLVLAVAAVWAGALLTGRPEYAYRPFLTPASRAAAAAVAGWAVSVVLLARAPWLESSRKPGVAASSDQEMLRFLQIVAVLVAFLWVRQELAGAVSSEVSTFLLIVYYAAAGVGAVFIGRSRNVSALRHAGLAVAVYAAIKAVGEAAHLSVALRIGGYLLAGAFLLAVAYWYRAVDDLAPTSR